MALSKTPTKGPSDLGLGNLLETGQQVIGNAPEMIGNAVQSVDQEMVGGLMKEADVFLPPIVGAPLHFAGAIIGADGTKRNVIKMAEDLAKKLGFTHKSGTANVRALREKSSLVNAVLTYHESGNAKADELSGAGKEVALGIALLPLGLLGGAASAGARMVSPQEAILSFKNAYDLAFKKGPVTREEVMEVIKEKAEKHDRSKLQHYPNGDGADVIVDEYLGDLADQLPRDQGKSLVESITNEFNPDFHNPNQAGLNRAVLVLDNPVYIPQRQLTALASQNRYPVADWDGNVSAPLVRGDKDTEIDLS